MIKQIDKIIPAPPHHMVGDGFRVYNMFPHGAVPISAERFSPFIMMDYMARHYFSSTDIPRGVGVHPHRGFETVTIVFEGKLEHHDSTGNHGVIGPGEVQWMTAARGVLHKEYHEKEFAKSGGFLHAIQLWVNLPSQYKMSEPKYQAITRDMIPLIPLNEAAEIKVIAGEYANQKGPASSFTPIEMYVLSLQANSEISIEIPDNFNCGILILNGECIINKATQILHEKEFVLFQKAGDQFHVLAKQTCQLFILAGQPIEEPVVSYGPFVMNSEQEIRQAFYDFQMGKFGSLQD